MATNIDIQGTPISKLPREANPAGVDVSGTKSGRTVKVSLNLMATKTELESVAVGLIFKPEVPTVASLTATYPNARKGWAAKVTQDNYIYQFDGDQWNNTGFTAFPGDVVTSPELNEVEAQIKLNLHNVFNSNYARKGYSINVSPPYEILTYPTSIITDFIEIPEEATKLYYSGFGLYPRFRFSPKREDTGDALGVSPSLNSGSMDIPDGYTYLSAQIYRGEDYNSADLSKVKISFDNYQEMQSLKKVSDDIEIISDITFVNLFDREKLRQGFAIDVSPPHSVFALTSMVFLLTDFIEIPQGATTLKFSGLKTFGNSIRCRLSKTPEDVSQSIIFAFEAESGTIDLTGYAHTYRYFCAMVYRANTMPTDGELNNISLSFNFGNVGEEISSLKKTVENIWENMPEISQGISSIVVDLPLSDGSDIQTGYAYIDSSTGNVKVKL